MGCVICGRGACAKSFHSLGEQKAFDEFSHMNERELIQELTVATDTIKELEDENSKLEGILNSVEQNQCGCCNNIITTACT